MEVYSCNPSTWEVEVGDQEILIFFGYVISWGQPGLHKILSKKKNTDLILRDSVSTLDSKCIFVKFKIY